ncbi:MAG: SAM-dependent methyltransferase [Bacilli bacterium]
MHEIAYEKVLNIQTSGVQQGWHDSYHYHRYEPTPYEALEQLTEQYTVAPTDHWIDWGCGKGRLSFFLHYFYSCAVTGVEMDEGFVGQAGKNLMNYAKVAKAPTQSVQFVQTFAEDYTIPRTANRFYFFNPFSTQIFMTVVWRIMQSIERYPRDVDLIMYYPLDEYIFFLNEQTSFEEYRYIKTGRMERDCMIVYRFVQYSN